ncbi:hypothetical protein [Catellatospora methionotrophica]|nr:hypothetical protein [Catellatospora methionotrophica]
MRERFLARLTLVEATVRLPVVRPGRPQHHGMKATVRLSAMHPRHGTSATTAIAAEVPQVS